MTKKTKFQKVLNDYKVCDGIGKAYELMDNAIDNTLNHCEENGQFSYLISYLRCRANAIENVGKEALDDEEWLDGFENSFTDHECDYEYTATDEFETSFYGLSLAIESAINKCTEPKQLSLLYDMLENRTRRCDTIMTEAMGEDWADNFNHFFCGD